MTLWNLQQHIVFSCNENAIISPARFRKYMPKKVAARAEMLKMKSLESYGYH
jgi:hypothetical protein